MASPIFQQYERTVRRIFWLDFLCEQLEAVGRQPSRASPGQVPLPETAIEPANIVNRVRIDDEPEPPAHGL
jgi:hypothetical protein